ncbi:MAG: hypothetical protein K2K48_07200 [Anaeroplasmataceae bacterium]|nr:hypothetical protein [Anaeroplasmataceae bacterium]
MGYKNGHYICDRCGAVSTGLNKGWNVGNSGAVCASCLEQEKQTKLLKEQNKLLKKQSQAKKSNEDSSKGDSQIGLILGKFLILIFKWIFCFIWGGPYILYKGIKKKSKLWIFVGVEFIMMFIIYAIIAYSFPEEHPLYYINYILIALLLPNVAILIYYYAKRRNDFDKE